MHVLYDDFSYGFYVYEFMMLSLLVDEGMVIIDNPTHIWSQGLKHIYHMDEGEVWQCPCHSLLAISP
jgi:hypothetical protein